MREIKFRAFDKEKKDIIYFGLFDSEHDESCRLWIDDYGKRYESDLIIMQYTGLKDKNGKKIYEGDIVKGLLKSGVIEFDKGLFGTNWDYGTDRKTMLGSWGTKTNLRCLHDGLNDKIEVIGNIYENPELLGE